MNNSITLTLVLFTGTVLVSLSPAVSNMAKMGRIGRQALLNSGREVSCELNEIMTY